MVKEVRSDSNSLNSIVELYENVSLVIIDNKSNEVKQYDTQKNFKADVDLNICEDERQMYFLVSDLSGNVLLSIMDESSNLIDIVKKYNRK